MPAFTKETWEAGKVDSKNHKNQWLIFANRGTDKEKVIANVHDMYKVIAPRRMNALLEETEANARLIASAPEMYRILCDVRDMLSEVDLDPDTEDDIHEILKYFDGK